MNIASPQIIILDLGSQYTQLIARELLSLGYKSIILKPDTITEYLRENTPKGIILSGGAASVYETDAPLIPEEIFSAGCPILGICYGMQYIAYREDTSLVGGSEKQTKEYGPIEVSLGKSILFEGLGNTLQVWASHGDIVREAPKGFQIIAQSDTVIEAIENISRKLYAVQFHPEVLETEDNNLILKNFAALICSSVKDWEPSNVIENIRNQVLQTVGQGKAAIGVSGGVDSTTLAALLAPVMKDRLYAFFIDTGGMRYKEVEEVESMCKKAGIDLHVINAEKEFLASLGNSIDAEDKRRRFKDAYQPIFKNVIEKNNITHILQGTLATDLIESGHLGGASMIKSHHNVGLDFGVEEVTPFAHLFKHEVRDIARSIGLESAISERKPFPGPGLFIRVVGIPITKEHVEKVRQADHLVTQILKKEPFYEEVSQVVVALLGAKTVGVQGDSRSYEYPIVVRVISSTDFMTVKGLEIPSDIRKAIITEVTRHGFNRVFFDETPKPPATTELE
jgi:GMP synthase (glutamine-hydrolysing)